MNDATLCSDGGLISVVGSIGQWACPGQEFMCVCVCVGLLVVEDGAGGGGGQCRSLPLHIDGEVQDQPTAV